VGVKDQARQWLSGLKAGFRRPRARDIAESPRAAMQHSFSRLDERKHMDGEAWRGRRPGFEVGGSGQCGWWAALDPPQDVVVPRAFVGSESPAGGNPMDGRRHPKKGLAHEPEGQGSLPRVHAVAPIPPFVYGQRTVWAYRELFSAGPHGGLVVALPLLANSCLAGEQKARCPLTGEGRQNADHSDILRL